MIFIKTKATKYTFPPFLKNQGKGKILPLTGKILTPTGEEEEPLWLRLYFLGLRFTADGDCSHEIKRCFLLERKAVTYLNSLLKSRDITSPTKVHLFKAIVFPVVMYGYESWTIKKAESGRIDAFELWCWRRLLSVPWTGRRSNQSTLK